VSRTIIVTNTLILPHKGGVENSLRHLAVEGVRLGNKVILVASDNGFDADFKVGDEYDIVTKKLYRSYRSLPRVVGMVLSFFSAIRLYREIAEKEKVECVIARSHLSVLAAKVAGLKEVIYVVPGVMKYQNSAINLSSSGGAGKGLYWLHCLSQKFAFIISDRLCVFSENMASQVRLVNGSARVSVINPGVDTERFGLRKRVFSSDRINLLFVGRLVAAKGVDLILQALGLLPASYRLTIVGDGEEKLSLVALSEDLGLVERVEFVGEVSNPEVYYGLSDVFLMSSLYEPFGQTILEASASGLPVVAFPSGRGVNTATEQILGDLAVYAKEVSPAHYASAILEAVSDFYLNESRSSADIRLYVSENYSWRAMYCNLVKSSSV